ncbi:MAG: nitronate monooxygenase [Roseburia inulinivorans]
MAKMMERAGADAVVAEGMESGGHIGSQTTMTLVPQVVDAVMTTIRSLPPEALRTAEEWRQP